MLLAQAASNPAEFWPTFVIQAGAFGLLTYIVVFLAPKIIQETKEERLARDQRFESIVLAMQTRFEERNNKIIEALDTRSDSWVEELRKHTAAVIEATKMACRYMPRGNHGEHH